MSEDRKVYTAVDSGTTEQDVNDPDFFKQIEPVERIRLIVTNESAAAATY